MSAPAAQPRFLVDGMLVRVGKYLRCLGYDATWDVRWTTREALRRAAAEGRVLVTANTRLGEDLPLPEDAIVLQDAEPHLQLARVLQRLALDPRAQLFTRCIRCNVPLEPVAEPASVRDRVAPGVWARHRRYWTCPTCATVFWLGSHVANTCRKLGLVPPPGTVG